jgi:hypothetical protein
MMIKGKIKDKIKSVVYKEQFQPSIIGMFVNPYYNLFSSDEYIGLEVDTPENRKNKKADVFYDGKRIPFPDSYFDWVISTEVFEHVFNPE